MPFMDAYIRWLRSKVGTGLVKAPGAGVVVRDGAGRVLLVRRADDGSWGITGGWVSPGESVQDAAVREVMEETGWQVRVTGLLGVYSDPDVMSWTYPNGDQAEFVNVIFEGRAVERVGGVDAETLEARFFAPHELPEIRQNDRLVVLDALSDAARPFIR